MSFGDTFSTLKGNVEPPKPSGARPRFGLTSDILSFRECARQYGFFGNDRYVPAQATQLYFGLIIHQILDRCHHHYVGYYGAPEKSFPTDEDIASYFDEVENALKSHGIKAANQAVRARAIEVLKTFNRLEGPTLYPRIFNTEYRLEADRDDYLLRGVVDVLVGPSDNDPDTGALEIWDYKGTRYPNMNSKRYKDYVWQMCVYAELYRVKEGRLPAKGVLYFLNELHIDTGEPEIRERPARAILEIDFTEEAIRTALDEFDRTAREIIHCRQNQLWPVPDMDNLPAEATCDICDVRWSCPLKMSVGHPRLPFT